VLASSAEGQDYLTGALACTRALQTQGILPQTTADPNVLAVEELTTPQAVSRVAKTPGPIGHAGYINRLTGWADAEAAMRRLHQQVTSTGRVAFITGSVTRLCYSPDSQKVTGATYNTQDKGTCTLSADLTIVAAGAWSSTLLDLRGNVKCSAQVLAYIALTNDEAEELSKAPSFINLSTGVYSIPPASPSNHLTFEPDSPSRLVLKISRHIHGIANPTEIPHPEPKEGTITISVPTSVSPPPSQLLPLRRALQTIYPNSAFSARPFSHSRFCHYADTPTADFLIDYAPTYGKSLFVATGGTGHAFKFLPVIGEMIVQCILGTQGHEWKSRWQWKASRPAGWDTEDGSRSGDKGLVMQDIAHELANL